jgi:hypothetical protein
MQFKRFSLLLVASLLVFILSVTIVKAQTIISPTVFNNKAAFDAYPMPTNSGCATFNYAVTTKSGQICRNTFTLSSGISGMGTFTKAQYDSVPKTGCSTASIRYSDNFVTATKCSPCVSFTVPSVCD